MSTTALFEMPADRVRCGNRSWGGVTHDHVCESAAHERGMHVCGTCAHIWKVTS